MTLRPVKWLLIILLLVAAALFWNIYGKLEEGGEVRARGERLAAPVQVADVAQGAIAQMRTFSGTLEAHGESVVASKLSGQVMALYAELADQVKPGQLLAKLDDAEYQQEVASAEAELILARANYSEAKSLLAIAERELQRLERLSKQGSASSSQLDLARAEQAAKQAQVAVSEARIAQAEAALEAAKIRLGYTRIHAAWQGKKRRWVAERLVDEGDNVNSNGPLLRIVELDPITAVFHITEREYVHLQQGQLASLNSDAYPGESFQGRVARISPVFNEATRQARIELEVENPQQRLKPGMFVRATVQLQKLESATVVPQQAISRRNEQDGVFVVEGERARWVPVQLGVLEGSRQQIMGEGLSGQVVTLGQQLLEDGSSLKVVEELQP